MTDKKLNMPVAPKVQGQNKYWLWMVARLFLGVTFITAGFLKLYGPIENFRGMIASYGVIPYVWIGPIASIIPWLEFISGICIVMGYFPRVFASTLGLLSLNFIGLITWAQINGTLPENCGCFGDGIHISPHQMMMLDALNVFLALKLVQIKTHRWCVAA